MNHRRMTGVIGVEGRVEPECDAMLLGRVRAEDAEAFAVLCARHRGAVRGAALGVLRDGDAAEDVTQEVLLRLWTRAEQWDGRGTVRGWLLRIAVNLALNARRTVTRRREQPLPMDEDLDALLDDAHPETALARAESAARMRGLLDELPADKRAVVRLVHQEDMAIRDVAAKLGIPEGTVKSRLYHARKLLARHWHELEDEP